MNKNNLAEVATTVLEDACSAAVKGRLPEKRKDPGSFTIPCLIGDLSVNDALADSGASINLMPSSMYAKLNLGNPKPVKMRIQLADKSVIHPKGILEDVLVKVNGLVFPVDFIIIDVNKESNVPLILGRPFLATADANIEVGRGKLTLRIDNEFVTFLNKYSKSLSKSAKTVESACSVSAVDLQFDRWIDEKCGKEVEGSQKMEKVKVEDGSEPSDPDGPSPKIKKLYNRVKSAVSHGNFRLPDDLSSKLSTEEKEELMMVVNSTWRANDWVVTKVKGARLSPFKFRPPNTSSVGAADTPPS